MKACPQGAILNPRELVEIQSLLEAAVEDWDSGVESASPANTSRDKKQVRHYKPLLARARKLWRSIENTNIARENGKPAASSRKPGAAR